MSARSLESRTDPVKQSHGRNFAVQGIAYNRRCGPPRAAPTPRSTDDTLRMKKRIKRILLWGLFSLAVLIVIGGPAWLQWAGAAMAGGSLVAFVLSRTVGLLGFSERGWEPSPYAAISVGAEVLTVLLWAGVALWCVGVCFEAVGDAQLERFRRDPANRGMVMDRGLWRYTRHPNYFGDACVWWGIFLVAAERWPGALTVGAPVVMTLLLTVGSGVRVLERHMAGRPGWDDYAARTSRFVPLPPKRRQLR